ncbi:hypothetical protein [Thermomonospora cellulosilytica]|uniref:Uncharacterized protein n=1 Tax=Thermomonospora cellulosilytica TaxID=1411118 RepID=A0A7W3RAH0_9ACTN|nr:hypothetical protein [Thermomonospora cellulosilytica]MBA9005852.1 hypothetical protein [Thermomonospora cellulosilytica]
MPDIHLELQAAAYTLRHGLPDRLTGRARVVEASDGLVDAVAICSAPDDHPDYLPHPDHTACNGCHVIEVGHPKLAELVAALLNARHVLAEELTDTAGDLEMPGRTGPDTSNEVHALALARIINGTDQE